MCVWASVQVKWCREGQCWMRDFKHSKGKKKNLPFPSSVYPPTYLNICLPKVYSKSSEVIFKISSNLGILILLI